VGRADHLAPEWDTPGILEVIMDGSEGKDFGASPEEEVTCAEEAPLYKKL